VDGDAREEEDGTVEVKVEEETDKAAHEVPEDPAVTHDVARHQERQRQAVHEVRRGQVHHVDQRGVPAPGLAKGAVEDDRVQGDAEEERERVADGQENVLVGLVYAAGRRWSGGGGRGGAEQVVEYADVGRNSTSGRHCEGRSDFHVREKLNEAWTFADLSSFLSVILVLLVPFNVVLYDAVR